jgi:glucose/arabinose dehydrogenase
VTHDGHATWERGLAVIAASAALLLLAAACSDVDSAPRRAGGRVSTTTTSATDQQSTPSATTTTTAPRLQRVKLVEVGAFDQPTVMAWSPDGSRAYVAERAGALWRVRPQGGRLVKAGASPTLDLTSRVEDGYQEQGLLGVAVTPDGAGIVVDFTQKGGTAGTTIVEHYALDRDGDVVPSSRSELLRVDQPFVNHNGGEVVFGPDGKLYIALGDGGSGNDPAQRAQNRGVLLGKILRLDLANGQARVPPDNPFVDVAGMRPEIWLYGVRNPWRFSFDTNGDLWVADVGQDQREEIDHLPAIGGRDAGKGANLGWSVKEGTLDTGLGHRLQGSAPIDPVFDYSHDDGRCSITGGFVVRSPQLAGLDGDYLFADFCEGTIDALGADREARSLHASVDQPSSFSSSPSGDAYVLSLAGEILRIEAD